MHASYLKLILALLYLFMLPQSLLMIGYLYSTKLHAPLFGFWLVNPKNDLSSGSMLIGSFNVNIASTLIHYDPFRAPVFLLRHLKLTLSGIYTLSISQNSVKCIMFIHVRCSYIYVAEGVLLVIHLRLNLSMRYNSVMLKAAHQQQ